MDLYGGWGDNLWGQGYLAKAIDAGLTTEAKVDAALTRTTLAKLRVGLLDKTRGPWRSLGEADVNSTASQRVAFEAALQGMVLLKNVRGALPLKKHGSHVAVVGPMGTDASLYHSDCESLPTPNPQGCKLSPRAHQSLAGRCQCGVAVLSAFHRRCDPNCQLWRYNGSPWRADHWKERVCCSGRGASARHGCRRCGACDWHRPGARA